MFGTGGGALIAKTMGEGDSKKANELFSLIVYAAAVCGIFIAVFGFIFIRPIAMLMGAAGELIGQQCYLWKVFVSCDSILYFAV